MTAPQRAPTVSAEEFESLHATPWRIPTPIVRVSRPWYVRAWLDLTRPIRRRWYSWHLQCIKDERESYREAGIQMGKVYLDNCEKQSMDLRNKQAWLDLE